MLKLRCWTPTLAVALAALPSYAQPAGRVVQVSTAAELQAAVNQGAENDIVAIAAGRYLIAEPLVLKRGMQLIGANEYTADVDGDRVGVIEGKETVLDGSVLRTDCTKISDGEPVEGTFCVPHGVVEDAGLGNRISRLTVANAIKANNGTFGIGVRYAFDPAVIGARGLSLWVSDCVFRNNRLGLAFNNAGAGMAGVTSTLVAERNIFKGNTRGVANFNLLASGATIHATYRDNFFAGGTNTGLQLAGGSYGSDDSHMVISSSGNRFEGLPAGITIVNGWHGGGPKASNGNWLTLHSTDDRFRGNARGILVNQAAMDRFRPAASTIPNDAAPGLDNFSRLQILGGTFANSAIAHVEVINPADSRLANYRSTGVPTGNVVELLIRHTTTDGSKPVMLRTPGDPSNRTVLIGSDVAVERSNDGVVIEGDPAE